MKLDDNYLAFQNNETSLLNENTWSNPAEFARMPGTGTSSRNENSTADLPNLVIEPYYSSVKPGHEVWGRINFRDFPAAAARLFDRLDTAGKGYLTQVDLGQAMQDNSIVGHDAQVLAALHNDYDGIKGLSGKRSAGVCKADLLAISNIMNLENPTAQQGDLLYSLNCEINRTTESQSPTEVCHELYRNAYDPISCIAARDIQQGEIGDCYLEATVAAMANQSPVSIVNMIRDNYDGTYTVNFPGDPARKPYRVSAPTEAELGLYNHGNPDGVWPTVLEKAFGAYRQARYGIAAGEDQADGADHGGCSQEAMQILTGHTALTEETAGLTDAQLLAQLSAANFRSTNILITADSSGTSDTKNTAGGYVANHGYTVLGVTGNPASGYGIIVRNPWGYGRSCVDVEVVPVSQFRSNFVRVNIGHA